MDWVALFLLGVLLYVIGSILDDWERARRQRALREWRDGRRRQRPHGAPGDRRGR